MAVAMHHIYVIIYTCVHIMSFIDVGALIWKNKLIDMDRNSN